MNNTIIKNALLNACGTALYIVGIASFLSYTPKIFGQGEDPKTVLIPIVMLSLLVFSVALVGLLIFGRPIFWYLDGKKKEAISLVCYTLAIFFIIMIIAVFALFLIS
jgi:hypothetical protein